MTTSPPTPKSPAAKARKPKQVKVLPFYVPAELWSRLDAVRDRVRDKVKVTASRSSFMRVIMRMGLDEYERLLSQDGARPPTK